MPFIHDGEKKKREKKRRRWTLVPYQGSLDRKALDERAEALGEDGLYAASEKLARKIFMHGPQYYFGDPEKKRRAAERAQSAVSVSLAACGPNWHEEIFGRKRRTDKNRSPANHRG